VPEPETRIEMLSASAQGAPNVVGLTVVSAHNMGLKATDDSYIAMHLSQAQRLVYGAAPPQVTAITLQLRHTDQLPAARARLTQLLAATFPDEPLEILDFDTLYPMYGQSIAFMDSVFGFMAVLIGVIVLFTIGNTMGTAVAERTVEIGTLRSIGLRRSGIRQMFIAEGLLLGLAGAALGVATALLAGYAINHSGLAYTPPGYVYAYLIKVRILQDTPLVAGSMLGLIGVAVCSAWWPANRAARLLVVDALRHT
jgi:putative ABC transport system permease protein